MKRFLLLILILSNQFSTFAFDYKVSLRDKVFNKTKYNFSVVKFVDGRLNKQKPIGSVPSGFSYKPHTVGNDSLEEELKPFFINNPSFIDKSNKIIVVLNQLNTRFLKSQNSMGGKKEELETTISLDYYKINNNECSLVYQQYYKKLEDVTFSGPTKGINNAFSEILKSSLQDFDNQLKSNQAIASISIDTTSLYSLLKSKPEQIINSQTIKDGIYFSCKDLYLNKPSLADIIFPDTSIITKEPITLKANNYIVDRAYAIVKYSRIFIYTTSHTYKEALLSDNGELYFPDVTRSFITASSLTGSAIVSTARAFLTIGFIGGFASSLLQDGIKKAGTTKTVSDVTIDFETGDLTFKE